MLFFGTICLGAMVYGFAHVIGGIVMPLYHPTLKRVGDAAQDIVEQASTKVYGYTEEDGFLQEHVEFRLDQIETLPKYAAFVDESYLISFSLTPREYREVLALVMPIGYFESYAHGLPLTRQMAQRELLIAPVLNYLDKIPEVRRSKV